MQIPYKFERLQDNISSYVLSMWLMLRDNWTPQKLKQFQKQKLDALVRYAVKNSPFYRDFYAHLDLNKPIDLTQLPILKKETMMENYDRFVTDSRLRLADLEQHISQLSYDASYLNEYRVLSTGGSSGVTGFFAFNRKEWTIVMTSNFRLSHYMKLRPHFFRPIRISVVGAPHLRHGTARIPESMNRSLIKIQRLNAAEPVGKLVQSLNHYQPETLFTYPSVGAELAIEQREGHLDIRPRFILISGEICTDEMKREMKTAWGITPFESYGCTEVMFYSITCPENDKTHVFEDLAILEVVDENNRPVPNGVLGHKILVTNLYYYTQPLIRYEISDILKVSETPCSCGRPFRVIEHIEGRNDDILELDSFESKKVKIHPICFRSALGAIAELRQYQVVLKNDGIHVNLVPRTDTHTGDLAQTVESVLQAKLKSLDVAPPPVYCRFVSQIEREQNQIGKIKIIKKAIENR